MTTPEAIKAYRKKYYAAYKLERKADRLDRERRRLFEPIFNENVKPKQKYYPKYNGMGDIFCSHFGCGRTLSITEQLFGNKCIHHSIKL